MGQLLRRFERISLASTLKLIVERRLKNARLGWPGTPRDFERMFWHPDEYEQVNDLRNRHPEVVEVTPSLQVALPTTQGGRVVDFSGRYTLRLLTPDGNTNAVWHPAAVTKHSDYASAVIKWAGEVARLQMEQACACAIANQLVDLRSSGQILWCLGEQLLASMQELVDDRTFEKFELRSGKSYKLSGMPDGFVSNVVLRNFDWLVSRVGIGLFLPRTIASPSDTDRGRYLDVLEVLPHASFRPLLVDAEVWLAEWQEHTKARWAESFLRRQESAAERRAEVRHRITAGLDGPGADD